MKIEDGGRLVVRIAQAVTFACIVIAVVAAVAATLTWMRVSAAVRIYQEPKKQVFNHLGRHRPEVRLLPSFLIGG